MTERVVTVEVAWELVGQHSDDPREHPIGIYSTRVRARKAKRTKEIAVIRGKRFSKCYIRKVHKTEAFLEALRDSGC